MRGEGRGEVWVRGGGRGEGWGEGGYYSAHVCT